MANKYYTLKDILSKNADYNLIIGERSNGKTFACLEYIIKQYVATGKTGAYIRRWKDDITGKRAESVFNAVSESGDVVKLTDGKYSTVVYSRGAWYLANYDNDTRRMIADTTPFCFAFSLSEVEHDKSTSYPTISTIVFDEFITRRYYLPDEFIIFMNVLSTIIRERNGIKIFMLGNTVNKFCPYFDEMGLKNISQMEQGTIDLYSYGDSALLVAVEYCATIQKKKKSNKYFAFENPKLNMITNGAWELAIYPHLRQGQKIKKSDVVFSFYIVFNSHVVQGDIVETGKECFCFCHAKTTALKEDDLIFTLDIDTRPNVHKSMLTKTSRIVQRVAWFFASNKVFYQSNDIGEIVHNYLLNCNR